jgi:LemA protein
MFIALIVVFVLFVIAAIWLVGIFNNLVSLRNRYRNAFAQIEVQLKRRYDLIPNLVETAKAYMAHEKETLAAVIAARNAAAKGLASASTDPSNTAAIAELAGAESALIGSMGRFSMLMEAYPDLKANVNMMQLSEELTSTENRLSFARQAFNDQVMVYNTAKQSFPAVFFAGVFGHAQDASLLEFADSAQIQQAPTVSF